MVVFCRYNSNSRCHHQQAINKEIQGDWIQQGGSFVVDGNKKLRLAHIDQYVGDNAQFSKLNEMVTQIFLEQNKVMENL